MATFTPTPYVKLDGARIATGIDGDGLAIVDGLTINWGRSTPLDQGKAATASVTLYDPTGAHTWPADMVGRNIVTGYDLTAGAGRANFRGRITGATLTPRTMPADDGNGTKDVTVVSLTAAGVRGLLANYYVTDTSLATESATQRRQHIMHERPAGMLTGGATSRPEYGTLYDQYQLDVDSQSFSSVLDDFYTSIISWWAYVPADDSVRGYPHAVVTGHYYALMLTHPAGDDWQIVVHDYGTNDGDQYPDMPALDGSRIETTGAFSQDIQDAITTVNMSYIEPSNGKTKHQIVHSDEADPKKVGQRTATISTRLISQQYTTIALDFLQAADQAHAGWKPPAMTYHAEAGTFPNLHITRLLLDCVDLDRPIHVGRNKYGRHLPEAPLSIIGGTVKYSETNWHSTITTAYRNSSMVWGTTAPLRWDTLPSGITWDEPGTRLDQSISWDDTTAITPAS